MKSLLVFCLFLSGLAPQLTLAAVTGLDSNSTSITLISATLAGRMLEVFENSGQPSTGTLDIQKFEANYNASVEEASQLRPSTKKVILSAANENLGAILSLLKSGQWGVDEIKAFYENLKTQQ